MSRFNRAPAGTAFLLPPAFATVLDAALDVAHRSDGAFDPTHGRAAALLGYGALSMGRPPTERELGDALAGAGWAKLDYDPASRRLIQPGGLWLDFSGIAKGFAVDAIADLVGAEGYPDVLVEIGGELAGRGLKPDGQPWWVDLEDPPAPARAPIRIGLHDMAVATSGNYVRGDHSLDPKTGRATENEIVAVTVIHTSAMLADAWATALSVAGPDQALDLASREALAACILGADGPAERLTPAFESLL
jgi:thiamine biosynthesis lipoprotein